MSGEHEITLTIHGLDEHHHDVDGEVFAEKFLNFLKGLAAADKAANGKRRYKFLISGLEKNTATARVREQVSTKGEPPHSSVNYYDNALGAIAADHPSSRFLPKEFLQPIIKLNHGVGQKFAFGEVKFKTGKVIRIDEFLQKRAERILREIEENEGRQNFFRGQAFGSFDGVLKLVDLRGEAKLAILKLSAGGLEIKCNVDEIEVNKLRSALDKRAIVHGLAHYDGTTGLPDRLDVRDIVPTNEKADLTRWRGAFAIPLSQADEDWGEF